jgi:hypothetical protein
MKTMLATTKKQLSKASLRVATRVQLAAGAGAERVAERRSLQLGFIVPVTTLLVSSSAYAVGCGSDTATSKLSNLIAGAAKFMMAIGGALALLCFVLGGTLIMVGHTSERVKKGKSLVTNALIGLAVMAAGFFIKDVLLSFVSGATGSDSGGNTSCLTTGNSAFQ